MTDNIVVVFTIEKRSSKVKKKKKTVNRQAVCIGVDCKQCKCARWHSVWINLVGVLTSRSDFG